MRARARARTRPSRFGTGMTMTTCYETHSAEELFVALSSATFPLALFSFSFDKRWHLARQKHGRRSWREIADDLRHTAPLHRE